MVWLWLVAAVVCIGFSAFYSGCETGLYSVNTVRLRLAQRTGRRSAAILSRMLRDREGSIITTLVGTNLSNYLATACVVSIFIAMAVPDSKAELLTTLVLTPIIFVFAEVTPKELFRREANTLMSRLIRPLRISDLLFRATGAVALLKGLARLAARCVRFGRDGALTSLGPRQQVATMLREGLGAGILTEEQSVIVDRVMSISTVRVRSAMIPRDSVRTVRVDAAPDRFLEQVRSHDYSRMPVLSGPDKVVGIVHVFDVLADASSSGGLPRPVTDFMSPPLDLEPDQTVTSALTEMQRRGVAMAIVTDPTGRFLGIVTVKDLVEEIVGDLQAW